MLIHYWKFLKLYNYNINPIKKIDLKTFERNHIISAQSEEYILIDGFCRINIKVQE